MGRSTLLKLALLLVASLIFSVQSTAQQQTIFSEDQELLMAVEFRDGTPVSDSISVFRSENIWFVPLGELADGLSLELKVSAALKKAEGFLIEENNRISIDLEACEFQIRERKDKFDCSSAVIYNDEIYLAAPVLKEWWGLHSEFLMNQSLVVLSAEQKYPSQARLERERRGPTQPHGKSTRQILYGLQPNPRKSFSGPSVDQQLVVRHQDSGDMAATRVIHDTIMSAELLGFETSAYVGGIDSDIAQWTATFSRKDADAGLFLKAREISLLDVLAPPVPLVSNNARVRGALISSYPLISPESFSFKEFTGVLPAGWEVELYQNDTLIGRQAAAASAEYRFQNVPLYYGLNRFKLIYYGPQGQRREELQLVNIDTNMALPKQRSYRFVAGQDITSKDSRLIGQYTHSFADAASATATYYNGAPAKNEESLHYSQVHLLSRLGRHLVGLNGTANNEGGKAYEGSVQTPFENASLGLRHALLEDFRSEAFGTSSTSIVQVTRANLGFAVPYFSSLRLTAEATRRVFKDERSEYVGVQRTSLQHGPVIFSHALNYDENVEGRWTGQLASIFLFNRKELRFTADYHRQLTNLSSSFQMPIGRNSIASFRAGHEVAAAVTDATATLNRRFKNFVLGAEVGSSTNGNYSAQALLSYGSIFNPVRKTQAFFRTGQTSYGAANVLVYLDANHNQIRDEGEQGLENIRVLINNQDAEELTGKDGYVLLSHLPTHQPVNLTVSYKSIPDPAYRPLTAGKTIVLRPGGAERLELPIGIFGEVSGVVNLKSAQGQKGKRGLVVELVADDETVAQSIKTESDGYFFFEAVPPGDFKVRLKEEQLSELSLVSQPKSYDLVIKPESPLERSHDFILRKK